MKKPSWSPAVRNHEYRQGYYDALSDSAAPDLYDALAELLSVHGETGPISARARAALAKARGDAT